jgi:hypothetical protein
MGIQFDDACVQGISICSLSASWNAFPLTASFHNSSIQFDELLVAVTLQACIGGSANMFRVQRITSFCFRFFVHSIDAMYILL